VTVPTEAPTGARGGRPVLEPIATADGRFAVLAIDQRRSVVAALERHGLASSPADVTRFKLEVCQALAPGASAVLLDPDYGLGPALRAGVVPPGVGVLVTQETETPRELGGGRLSTRHPGRDAAFVARSGGQAAKLLVWLRPDRPRGPGEPDLVAETLALVRTAVADCRAAGLACVVEALGYPLPGEAPLGPEARAAVVVESARLLAGAGPDLLKLEYPGSPAGCRRVTDAVGLPWALLSAGVGFDEFHGNLRVAMDAGASGFIAGRAIWKEAMGLDGHERVAFLDGVARGRLDACVRAMEGRGRPFAEAARAAGARVPAAGGSERR
jgi:tagatose-1,6-bisphosphate aldolase